MDQIPKDTASVPDEDGAPDRLARTRRGFLGAFTAALLSGLGIGLLWLLSRGAPSAGRDPALTPPATR